MPWTHDLKLQTLLALPWTVMREDGDDPGERIIRVKELPDVIVAGPAATDADREALAGEFWASLTASIKCYLEEDVDPPLPARLAGSVLPWRIPSPAVEQKQPGFAFAFTPSSGTGAVRVQAVAETEMPPGRVEELDLNPAAA